MQTTEKSKRAWCEFPGLRLTLRVIRGKEVGETDLKKNTTRVGGD